MDFPFADDFGRCNSGVLEGRDEGLDIAITLLGERLHLLEVLGTIIVLSAALLIVRYDKA